MGGKKKKNGAEAGLFYIKVNYVREECFFHEMLFFLKNESFYEII